MPDVLIYGDSIRSPEMRHEVPLAVPDPFLYAERDGRRVAVVSAMEAERIAEADGSIEVFPNERFGIDELIATGKPREEVELELLTRACREIGVSSALVPPAFPVQLADHLRAQGIELKPDGQHFTQRRRVKTEAELAGIRRAQRGAEAGMAAARDLLRRAQPNGSGLAVDGEPLTCERLKLAVENAFTEHGVAAEEFIVSHGPQTAIGHEMGHGPIAPGEAIVLDLFPRDRETGCYADMTRTFVVGEPDEELVRYQQLCLEALELSVSMIRPGVAGFDLHRAVCDFFQEHGFPTQLSKQPGEVLEDGFFHGLGHGVGLEVHEQPWLGRAPGELVAGDVVAVEPGLYKSGWGGCRLEDLVLVTESGGERLTDFPYDLAP
jgi:Xaa-Pro aminopeptidase